mmetsp:Transcript_72442/g.169669  ORF Transcript_72442/g.169669 Transcript_72442/m.169669 type:complete len:434 (+) Transcript_72442:53-1354(+)
MPGAMTAAKDEKRGCDEPEWDAGLRRRGLEAKGDEKLLDFPPARTRNETGSTMSLGCLEEDAEDSTTDGNADDAAWRLDDDFPESCASPVSAPGAEPGSQPKHMVLLEEEQETKERSGCVLGVLVFLSVVCGCSCQAPYEVLNSQDKGCSHLISLTEHLFGLLVTFRCAARKRQLPLRWHLVLAAGSIGYTQLQNAALGTQLPTLVLITIKNGNLAANIILGKVFLRRQYGLQQLAAVLLLSFGLLMLSVVGATPSDDSAGDHSLWSCLLGIVLLAGALLSRAAGALAQEHWSKSCSIPVEELLFFRSLLGLPAVLINAPHVLEHGGRWLTGAVAFSWPGPWALLALNTVMDYVTRLCITHLIEQTSALTANLILTLQRFVSFILSAAFLASESPSRSHWLGAVAVLAGTLLYAVAPTIPPPRSPASLKERCG